MKLILLGAPGAGKVLRQKRLLKNTVFRQFQQVIFFVQP